MNGQASTTHDDLEVALRRVRWDGHQLCCEVCLRPLEEELPVPRAADVRLTCQLYDLWRLPVGARRHVECEPGMRLFRDGKLEKTIAFRVEAPDTARFVSVRYRKEEADLDWDTPLARLPRAP